MLIRQNFDLHILESTEHLTILHHGDLNCSKGGRCEVGKEKRHSGGENQPANEDRDNHGSIEIPPRK
jgi:hypothetical protein